LLSIGGNKNASSSFLILFTSRNYRLLNISEAIGGILMLVFSSESGTARFQLNSS
jgi:hypothetical protein